MTDSVAIQSSGRLRTHLIKGAAGSFVLQVGFAGFAFLNAIILARVLGAGGYGAFANAMAWVSLLTIPATFGFGILLVRDTAIYRSQGKWSLLKGLLRFSNRIVLVLSVALALVAAAFADFLFSSPNQALMRHTIWIALGLLPLLALYNLREATTRGLEYVIRARLPGMIVRPGLLLAGIVSLYYFWQKQLSAPTAMAVNVSAGIVTLALGMFFLYKLLPQEVKAATPEYTPRPWLKAAFPMLVYGGAQIVLGQTDIVMLGAMRGAHEVGLYAAANRLAYLLMYMTVASDIIVAPIISRLYAKNEKIQLQRIITKASRLSFLTVLPVGILFIALSGKILSIFGKDFVAGNRALIILVVGRLLCVALGSGNLFLGMTGNEKPLAQIIMIISLVNILLNLFLISEFGICGAALATALSLVAMYIISRSYGLKKTDVDVSIWGRIQPFRSKP